MNFDVDKMDFDQETIRALMTYIESLGTAMGTTAGERRAFVSGAQWSKEYHIEQCRKPEDTRPAEREEDW